MCALGKTRLLAYLNVLLLLAGQGPQAKPVYEDDPTGTDKIDWWQSGQDEIKSAMKASAYNVKQAKNVILFIGDGMGTSTVTAARWLLAQTKNISIHEAKLSWENFSHAAHSKTYAVNVKTTDSAAAGTAILTGQKTRSDTIGVSQRVHLANCSTMTDDTKINSTLHHSHMDGKWTGVITTVSVTHATPASSYAHSPDRAWEADSYIPADVDQTKCKDIASQLIEDNHYIRVVLGGGRKYFMPENETDPDQVTKGTRTDGRNLLEAWKEKKKIDRGKLVMTGADFNKVHPEDTDYLMGLFAPKDMNYNVDRKGDKDPQPSLADMTKKAIEILKRSENGFFLLVEGGMIDKAHHDGNAYMALTDTLAFSEAVQVADEMMGDDTLIVVTADHSHVFVIGGYPSINQNIFDVSNKVGDNSEIVERIADDGKPISILSYANGPGYVYHFQNDSANSTELDRRDLTEDSNTKRMFQKDYLQPAGVPIDSETHGGEDVPIYARGPMSHLFHGVHEANYIGHVMMYASCVGPNKDHCLSSSGSINQWRNSVLAMIAVATSILLLL